MKEIVVLDDKGNIIQTLSKNEHKFTDELRVGDEVEFCGKNNCNQETTLKSYLKEQLKDPEFAKAYKEAKEEIEKELKEEENE